VTSAGRRSLTYAAAGLIAAALLFYSLRGVDWAEVGALFVRASPWPLLIASAIASATLFLRALRWRILLVAGGQVGVPTAFWATAAGYLGNNFLPARAGEIVRTAIISARTRLAPAFVLATALAERIADAVALILISAIVLFIVPAPPGWMRGAARSAALIGFLGAAGIAVLPFMHPLVQRIVVRLPLSEHARDRLVAAAEHALNGLRTFHDPGRIAAFIAVTIVIWYLDALGSVLAASALGLRLSLPVAFLLIAGLSVGSALPSTPGYVGIYQFVAVTVLTPFGFTRSDAIAFILLAQAMMYVVIGVWGGLALLRFTPRRPSPPA
jgi:uncharacterized protein (TIRG00374 family)